jgi:mannitol/fructose-specific phosphotransferase system IIA component (Ntr-type)
MKVSSLLTASDVTLGLKKGPKHQIIEDLVDILVNSGSISQNDRGKVVKAVVDREKQSSTGLEKGIAVPHAKTDAADQLLMALGISEKGIDFDSIDGAPSHLFFLLLAPTQIRGPHLQTLAEISRITSKHENCIALSKSRTPQEAIDIIIKAEEEKESTK